MSWKSWGKGLLLLISAALLIYLAVIYNSISLLLPALLLFLAPLLETGLLLFQRRQMVVSVQCLQRYTQQNQEAQVLVKLVNHSHFPLCNVTLFFHRRERGDGELKTRKSSLSAHGERTVCVPFQLERCGIATLVLERVRLRDWLGFFEIPLRVASPEMAVTVYPPLVAAEVPVLQPMAAWGEEEETLAQPGQGGEQAIGVREYRSGDRLKEIHWKMSARAGEWMVREYAQSLSCQCVLALDLARLSTLSEQRQDAVYGRLAGYSLGFLQKGVFHYLAGCVSGGQRGENAACALFRQPVTEEEALLSFLQRCYQEQALFYRAENQTSTWTKGAADRKKQMLLQYEIQYESFPSDNFIDVVAVVCSEENTLQENAPQDNALG